MPQLIRLVREHGGTFRFIGTEDGFLDLAEDADPGAATALLVSFSRFQSEGDAWLADGRILGVRLAADEAVEGLVYDLPRLALVALKFPKFRDGRAYSSAVLLRERYGYRGELRAVGDVLRDQAAQMVRCGFDAFVPADGATPQDWALSPLRHRHVYQAGPDRRLPAFLQRAGGG